MNGAGPGPDVSTIAGALQAQALRGSPESGRLALFLPFQHLAKLFRWWQRFDGPFGGGRQGGGGREASPPLQGLHPLLDQHLGHVAHGAGFLLRQGGQALAELFRQHHLNAGRLGSPAGRGLTGRHDRGIGSDRKKCTKLVKGSIQQYACGTELTFAPPSPPPPLVFGRSFHGSHHPHQVLPFRGWSTQAAGPDRALSSTG